MPPKRHAPSTPRGNNQKKRAVNMPPTPPTSSPAVGVLTRRQVASQLASQALSQLATQESQPALQAQETLFVSDDEGEDEPGIQDDGEVEQEGDLYEGEPGDPNPEDDHVSVSSRVSSPPPSPAPLSGQQAVDQAFEDALQEEDEEELQDVDMMVRWRGFSRLDSNKAFKALTGWKTTAVPTN
jgi:hypothetical protein